MRYQKPVMPQLTGRLTHKPRAESKTIIFFNKNNFQTFGTRFTIAIELSYTSIDFKLKNERLWTIRFITTFFYVVIIGVHALSDDKDHELWKKYKTYCNETNYKSHSLHLKSKNNRNREIYLPQYKRMVIITTAFGHKNMYKKNMEITGGQLFEPIWEFPYNRLQIQD